MVLWANFVSHAHKHADETSMVVWAGGKSWWENVGYWPYGVEGRSEAESWSGSNAPHLELKHFSSRQKISEAYKLGRQKN